MWRHGRCAEVKDASDGAVVQMWRRCCPGKDQSGTLYSHFFLEDFLEDWFHLTVSKSVLFMVIRK